MSWYNLLIEKGYTDFVKKEEVAKETEKEAVEPVKEESAPVKKRMKQQMPKTKKRKKNRIIYLYNDRIRRIGN